MTVTKSTIYKDPAVATEMGWMALSPKDAFFAAGGDIEKFKPGEIIYSIDQVYRVCSKDPDIDECPECDSRIDSDWDYCPYCGCCIEDEREAIHSEIFTTIEKAKSSEIYKGEDAYIDELIAFTAKVKEEQKEIVWELSAV